MKKTLILALALTSVSLAGCADDAAETTEPVIVDETTPVITDDPSMMEADPMMDDTTMMDGSMEAAPADGAMDAAPMDTPMEGETSM